MTKPILFSIISFLCVCKAATNAVAENNNPASAAFAESVVVKEIVVDAADKNNGNEIDVASAASAVAKEDNKLNPPANDVAAESSLPEDQQAAAAAEVKGHNAQEHHELTEAFGIIDENKDGVLQKEEIVKAIKITDTHHGNITPEQFADKLMMREVVDANSDGDGQMMKIDMDTFAEMLKNVSFNVLNEGEAPPSNQQMSQLASDVLISYFHIEPEEDPSTWYNPHNMTYDELEYHLYEWEEDAVGHVTEYLDWDVFAKMRNKADDWYKVDEEKHENEKEEEGEKNQSLKDQKHRDDGSKTKVEMRKSNTHHYLKLSNDVAHVVEFYAPWCPHCQDYKWEYIEIATETKRRATTTQVEFHAVSCDVYWRICSTYDVDGFPTIMGWKKGESLEKIGITLNEEDDIYPDLIGEMLELDLADEAVEVYAYEFETEKEKLKYEKKQAEKAKAAAKKKTSWHQHTPHTHNDKYHNAALSFAFALKSQLFQTMTNDGKMEPKRKSALVDFLNLMEWTTPPSWNLRTGFVKELQWNLDLDAITSREVLESVIDADVHRHRTGKQNLLWGYVDPRQSWASGLFSPSIEQLAIDDKKWTKTCTHSEPAKGFTCGLWNLFHIVTIGSSKPEHEIYGFHRGYFVSPHHVAQTIRNFVQYFFSCDVCRTNFLNMYDNCGHDHCTRLKSEINIGPKGETDKELALWLWEVHNSVNARLMKEAAQRQNRNVTHEETLASMFPTKKMCPDCWLDENMTKWDNETVFKFLNEWYWPADLSPNPEFKSVITGQDIDGASETLPSANTKSATRSWGVYFISISCLVAFSLAVVTATHKRRERRKKFVDSRFVAKKQKGCFQTKLLKGNFLEKFNSS